jgi:hypothetical protein
MAQRIRDDTIDQEEIDRALDSARYFLRFALDPPIMCGAAECPDCATNGCERCKGVGLISPRDEAIKAIDEMVASLDATELRALAYKHRANTAAKFAVQALDRAAG